MRNPMNNVKPIQTPERPCNEEAQRMNEQDIAPTIILELHTLRLVEIVIWQCWCVAQLLKLEKELITMEQPAYGKSETPQ